jgi:hypothetical protein
VWRGSSSSDSSNSEQPPAEQTTRSSRATQPPDRLVPSPGKLASDAKPLCSRTAQPLGVQPCVKRTTKPVPSLAAGQVAGAALRRDQHAASVGLRLPPHVIMSQVCPGPCARQVPTRPHTTRRHDMT